MVSFDYGTYTQTTVTPTRWYQASVATVKKTESKKDKIRRIAKAKMFASWKTYDQKNRYVIQVKQLCKPQHRVNHIVR